MASKIFKYRVLSISCIYYRKNIIFDFVILTYSTDNLN